MEESPDVQYIRLRDEVNKELSNAIALLKLVKDTEFCNEAENQLARLKDVMIEDKRFRVSTLEEFRKIIRKGVHKTLSKLVLENPTQRFNSGIYGPNILDNLPNLEATSYFNLPTQCYSPNNQFSTNSEQRLALKYPRKKICKPSYDSTSNISRDLSQNSLFKRRHELLAPPPQPTTYGEYKRMTQYQNYLRNQNMLPTATVSEIPVNEYEPSSSSKQLVTSDQIAPAANRDKLCKSNGMISEKPQTDSINVERISSETVSKTNQQQSDSDSLVTNTKTIQQQSVSEDPVTATAKIPAASVNEDSVTPTTTHQQQSVHEVHESGTSKATTDHAAVNAEISKPPKHKSKGNHRELHDLLSYTTEIFPKLNANRRKSVSAEEEVNTQLLRKFGITKKVQIVLKRVNVSSIASDCEEPEQIAQRTRSKSIDSRKCVESLDAKPKQTEPVPNKIKHRRESKVTEVKVAKPTVPVHSKISHRRESKSLDLKKQPAAVTNVKVSKQTARKSLSKPQKMVHPVAASKKKGDEVKAVIENVTNEIEKKPTKESIVPRKRQKSSANPQPPPPKRLRLRSTTKDAKNFQTVDDKLRNKGEESDEEEPATLVLSADMVSDPKPNNDADVHCRSDYMEKCCLCAYSGELMVQHYVYNHPKKAVYVSRIAPEQAKLIRADPLGISGRKAISRYGDQEIIVFRCHFCDLRLSESQELWLDHISKHTGEYRYKCMLCPIFARLPVDRVPHHSICTNPSMQLWHTYAFEENHLYAYMCNACNFVQVLSVNMMRHIREDHPEAGPSVIGYTKFSLVNFSLQDDEAELPYGAVKLEPILDDTNIILQENIKDEAGRTPAEDSEIDPLQDVQEQQHFVPPETVYIKQENLTDSIDLCETNAFESMDENETDALAPGSASVPQETNALAPVSASVAQKTECSLSNLVRVKRLPGDTLSAETESNIPGKALKATTPVNHSSPFRTYDNRVKQLLGATLSTGTVSNKLDKVPTRINQVNHSLTPRVINYQLQHSTTSKPINVCSGNGQQLLAPVSSMVVLKPWSEKGDCNSGKLQSNKLTVPFLIAPYKCTAFDCGFYTDQTQAIITHLQSHLQRASIHQIKREDPWVECCYCNYVGTDIFSLLQHIKTMHRYCGYQCDRCCYRSRDPSNVRVHQRNYHSEHDAEAKILCIPDRQKAFESKDDDIIVNKLRSNVMVLKCSICTSKKFYDLNEYRKHIIAHNMSYIACHVCERLMPPRELIDHIHSHNIYMFQCVYCVFGTSDMRIMKKHVADKHPENLLCFHVRTSKPNVPSFIRVQEKIMPDRFVHFTTS